jgi:hypothetical protein
MMPYTTYFNPGPADPTELPVLALRLIDGHWHVVATEPGHCEHVHGEGFPGRGKAQELLERIRQELLSGRRLDIVHSWETRALVGQAPWQPEPRSAKEATP